MSSSAVTVRLLLSGAAFALGGWAANAASAWAAVALVPLRTFAIAPAGAHARLVYVANYGANSITAYVASASGNARPLIAIAGPHTLLDHPAAIAHDPQGRLYVVDQPPGQNGGSVLVFARGASGDAAPMRSFRVANFPGDGGPGGGLASVFPLSIAVDRRGYTYVGATSYYTTGYSAVLVYGSAAQGTAAPLRVFANGYRSQVAVNTAGQVYVVGAVDRFNPPHLGKFSAFPDGNVLLDTPTVGQNDFQNTSGIAVAPRSGDLYDISNGGAQVTLGVFDSSFMNIIGHIRGGAAGLGAATSGIAVDGLGQVYVGTPDGLLRNSVEIFSAGARGNVAPIRTIVGPNTGLDDPVAIALID